MKKNMNDKKIESGVYKDIIMDLSINKTLIEDRLKKLKESGKTIEETPKIIVIDIITTSQLYATDKEEYKKIIQRVPEIDFDEELIENRDIGYILLDYFADVNNIYYKEQNYYQLIEEMAFA